MELQFYGANCIKVTTKKSSIIIDDNLESLGLKSVTKPTDVALITAPFIKANTDTAFVATSPGEYEVQGLVINGIAARANMDEEGKKSAVIYVVDTDDLKIAVVGHVHPDLDEAQLEAIGMVDILIIPVGGSGYTLDPVGALKIIKKIEPKVVIPTHYAEKGINYEVPQLDLETAIKGLGMEPAETVEKLKLKAGELTDTMRLIVLK